MFGWAWSRGRESKLNYLCGAEGCGNPGPFHIKPKVHAEEEEMSEDEQRRSKLLGDVAENNPVLDELRSRKEKVACPQGQPPRASQTKRLTQWASYGDVVEEQFQERLSPPY